MTFVLDVFIGVLVLEDWSVLLVTSMFGQNDLEPVGDC